MVDRELEGKASFELFCRDIERLFAEARLGCQCCAGAYGPGDVCATCTHAPGFHECEYEDPTPSGGEEDGAADAAPPPRQRWKAGTLHAGKLDLTAAMLSLAKKHVPREELERLLETAVKEGHLRPEEVDDYREMYEQVAGVRREVDASRPAAPGAGEEVANRPMTVEELRDLYERLTATNRSIARPDRYSNSSKQKNIKIMFFCLLLLEYIHKR